MTESSVKDFKSKYLASIKDGFQSMEENKSHLERVTILERHYPRLRPIQINRGQRETIPYSGTLLEFAEVSKTPDRYCPSLVQDLFVPDNDGFVPQTLVLVGPHGAGKTTTSLKILSDWASGNLYADKFDFVLRITGRGINQIAENINLTGLVSHACKLECSDDVIRSIFSDPSKVLLIIDGFDELMWTLEDDCEDCQDLFQATHKETFIRGLLNGEALSGLTLLITSRTFSLRKMKEYVRSPSVIELPGFSQKDLEEYFQNFFQNKDQEDQALSVLKENEVLSALCSVPLTCWLVGSIVKAGMQDDLSSANCKTLSSVYLLYLQSLLAINQPINACLRKLCALANEGLLNQKFLFESDFGSHELSPSDAAAVLYRDAESPNKYSFIHMSVQEFLAALYYVLGEEAEIKETNGAIGDTFLPRVCKGRSLCEQVEDHPQLLPTVRFLFGLINDKRLNEIARAADFSPSLRAKAAMEDWLLAGRGSKFNTDALLCFYEAQDEELRGRAFHVEDLCFYSGAMENIPTREILYCTNHGSYQHIALEDFLMRPKDLELLSPIFHGTSKLVFTRCGFAEDTETGGKASWMSSTNIQIKELEFHVCVVAPCFFQDLCTLLSTSQSLSKLSLTHHIVDDSAMKSLCDGLRHPACPLQELILDDCSLNPTSCKELGSAIQVNRSLQKLDLALNKIEDAGVTFLCEGLKDPGCALKELSIDDSDLSPACCEDLRSLLMTNRSLTTLSIKDNDLQDSGAKLICEGLLHPCCPLKELSLNENNFTSSSCEDFRSVLLANRTLTSLDLTYNPFGDDGVKVLCEALQDPACTLQELMLLHCELSPACCNEIASVINANRSLTKLDLTWNKIQDSGAKDLCKALKSPSCTLQELRLDGCGLTCCEELASAINANRSLTKLDLSDNQFGDSGMKLLCQALCSPSCTLQEIRMGYFNMVHMHAEEDLLAVINTNQCLEKVELSFRLDEEPSPDLWKIFHYPACTLEKNKTQDGTIVHFKYAKK